MKKMPRRILLLSLLAGGCATPPEPQPSPVPEGLYFLESAAFYKRGLARVQGDGRGGVRVTLLDHFGGGFTLRPRGGGRFQITDDDVDLADVRRRLSGEGTWLGDRFSGLCVARLRNLGPISRDHREQPWTLTPAAEPEAQRALEKLRKLYPGRLEGLGL
jgi:hypothetical protein